MRENFSMAVDMAAEAEESDVTSRGRVSRLGDCGRVERVDGLRAVAMTREVVC